MGLVSKVLNGLGATHVGSNGDANLNLKDTKEQFNGETKATNGVNGHSESNGISHAKTTNGVNGHAESDGINGINGHAKTANGVNGHAESNGTNGNGHAEFNGTNGHTIRPFVKAPVYWDTPERKQGHLHSLPELVDFNAVNNTDHPFCVQAQGGGKFQTVTHGDFKIAVSRCAAWLKDNLPIKPASGEKALTKMAPVALFMESDIGLVIHEFALMSLGVAPLVLSPRLPSVAIGALLEATCANSFIVSKKLSPMAQPALAALSAKGISTHVGSSYHDFIDSTVDAKSIPEFEKPEGLDDIILLLHSSGTTGLPKPIETTHRQLLFAVSCHKFDTEEQAQSLTVSTLPLFHGFGLVAPGLAMSAGKTILYPATDGIPNASSIVKLVKETNAKAMMTVPFLLDDICNLPDNEGIDALLGMDFVGTGGAALGAGVGDRLAAAGVKLLNFYGTTETGPLSLTFAPTDEYDWKYFRLRTDVKYHVDETDSVEGQRRFRLTVYPPGRPEGFTIADQLIRNERYPETDFAAIGREDDVIVMATGEKANPLIVETMLSEAPMVKSAIAFGENQFSLGIIVEPAEPVPADKEAAFVEAIWPIITAAGEKMDAYSRIPSRDAVVIVPQGTVIPRTDKGSIARKDTYALMQKEIAAVYERLLQAETDALPAINSENLEQDIKDRVEHVLKQRGQQAEWAVDDSLFDLGIDSLQVLQVRRALIAGLSKSGDFEGSNLAALIPPEFLYINPSVRAMASAIRRRDTSGSASLEDAAKEVHQFVEEYALTGSAQPAVPKQGPAIVILTGSSGSLGAHCLADLARRPNVVKVVCLVRKEKGTNSPPVPGAPFDRKPFVKRGIELTEEQWAKVSAVEVDPTADRLGLIPPVYGMMQQNITHVVHAAWPMNYLMKLTTFQYQFKFLRNLLELASGGEGIPRRRFVFMSSIAAVARVGLTQPGTPVSEAPVTPEEAVCGIGYADGKLVCEKILERAAETHGSRLEITSLRCGQMTGARTTGIWNANEQVPMLLKTGQNLGRLPQLSGDLCWLPVDDAASAISDICFSSKDLPIVMHLSNPAFQPWSQALDLFAKELGVSEPSVPFDEWMKLISDAEADDERFPVKKLEVFFKSAFQSIASSQVILGTSVSEGFAQRLEAKQVVDESTLKAYVAHWKKIGYLSDAAKA